MQGNLTSPDRPAEPLVSVVIPLLNHEPYLVSCLESVKRDSYHPIELLVIDDGSRDRSYSLLQDWVAENTYRFVRVVISTQNNSGITRTLNRLVAQSEGEFIFPLASDDEVASNGIAKLVGFYLKQIRKPTLVFSDAELIDPEGESISVSACSYYKRNAVLLSYSKRHLSYDVVTKWGAPYNIQFFPKALFERLGGYDESLQHEDYCFALKNVASGSVVYAPVTSRRYRLRAVGSITPGLKLEDLSPLEARKLVMHEFNPVYRVLIWLVNLRDAPIKSRSSELAGVIIRKFGRLWVKLASLTNKGVRNAEIDRSVSAGSH